jgi:hypothetical protein
MNGQRLRDPLANRITGLVLEANSFEEERILAAIFTAIATPGSDVGIIYGDGRPSFSFRLNLTSIDRDEGCEGR